jgi:hypothetical protein
MPKNRMGGNGGAAAVGSAYHERQQALGLGSGASDAEACGITIVALTALPPAFFSAALRKGIFQSIAFLHTRLFALAGTTVPFLMGPVIRSVHQWREQWHADLRARFGPILATPVFAFVHLLLLLPLPGAAAQIVERAFVGLATSGARAVSAIAHCVEPRSARLWLAVVYLGTLLLFGFLVYRAWRREAQALVPAMIGDAVEVVAVAKAKDAPLLDCVICADSFLPDQGLCCAAQGHFTCTDCASRLVHSFASSSMGERQASHGRVRCPKAPTECNGVLAETALARVLSEDLFQAYLHTREAMLEQRLVAESDRRLQAAMRRELEKLGKLDERQRRIRAAMTRIVEEHLTTKCPRAECRQAYHDFEGCAALRCSRCSRYFCGWCLAACDASSDAHAHVASCSEKPAGVDALFPRPRDVFDGHWKRRKARGMRLELSVLPPEEATEVSCQLRRQGLLP